MNGHLVSEPLEARSPRRRAVDHRTGTATLTAAREVIFTDEAELLSPLTAEEQAELYRLVIKVSVSAPGRN
jgi:hypothetical protein